jgi:branched-chain amino acid transport system substrate-binding protein
MYTYYAGVTGTPTCACGRREGESVRGGLWPRQPPGELGELGADFKKKFNDYYYTYATVQRHPASVGNAMAKGEEHRTGGRGLRRWKALSVKSFAG